MQIGYAFRHKCRKGRGIERGSGKEREREKERERARERERALSVVPLRKRHY